MSGGALGSILGRLLPKLIRPAISVGKNILAPLGLSAAMSAADAGIQKSIFGSGTTVIFSNEEINDMIKIVKALEDSDVLVKGVTKTLQNDIRELHSKKGGALQILPILLGTLGPSLIGNLLTGKGLFRAGSGNKCNCRQGMYRTGSKEKGMFRAGQGIKKSH